MNPKLDFSKSSRAFQKTMREYAKYSKKEASDVLNKKAKDVAIRCIRFTPRADRQKVKSALEGPSRKGGSLKYALIKKDGLSRAEIKKKAGRFLRARLRAIGYVAAGWYKAAQAFGGRGGKLKSKGLAAQGRGIKSTPWTLTAILENRAIGAEKIASPALASALDYVRRDMLVYLAKKYKQAWRNGKF